MDKIGEIKGRQESKKREKTAFGEHGELDCPGQIMIKHIHLSDRQNYSSHIAAKH
jgi:hypothetical protein